MDITKRKHERRSTFNHLYTPSPRVSPRRPKPREPSEDTFCPEQKSRVRFKQDLSGGIVSRLRQSKNKTALALAERIERCANPNNVFVADDFHNADGESYQANGSLWACNSILCQNCAGRLSRDNRKTIRYVMDNEKLLTGEDWFSITPTMPDALLHGYSLDFIRLIYQKAFETFTHCNKDVKKHTPYQKLIRGMFKNCEFTCKETCIFHFHSHLLTIAKSKKIQNDDFYQIRYLWTKALRKAFEFYDVDFVCRTSDKKFHAALFMLRHLPKSKAYLIPALLKCVNARARFLGLVNVNVEKVNFSNREKTIQELSKYVTKSDSWENIPLEEIEKIVERPRRARMFEALGACRDAARKMREAAKRAKEAAISETLINPNREQMQAEIDRTADEGAYLDTKRLIPRKRRPSWRVRVKEMTLAEYRLDLESEIEAAQRFRRQQLRHRFPCATFETLGGARWFGAWVEPESTQTSVSLDEYRWKPTTLVKQGVHLIH